MLKTHDLDVISEENGGKTACLEFLLSLSLEGLTLSDTEESLAVHHSCCTLEDRKAQRVLSRGHCELE